MENDTGLKLKELKVDGGMVKNELLMQLMADILGKKVVRRDMLETSCLGAAVAAGMAVGVWNPDRLVEEENVPGNLFQSRIKADQRRYRYAKWKDAVKRTMNWVDDKKALSQDEGVFGVVKKASAKCCFVYGYGISFVGGIVVGLLALKAWNRLR